MKDSVAKLKTISRRSSPRFAHGLRILVCCSLFLFVLGPEDARGQITVDNTSNASGNTNSLSWAHTVGTGANRILVVGVSNRNGGTSVTGVTYGGTALTQIGIRNNGGGGGNRMGMWRLLAPPPGTANIVVSLSAVRTVVAGAISFNNVNQATPTGTFASAIGTSTAASVNVTSAAGEVVVDTVAALGPATSIAFGAGQTQRWNVGTGTTNSDVRGGGSTEAGAASVTMSWALGVSEAWTIGGVSLRRAAPAPDLSITKSHSGNFTQGQTGATYSITATNSGTANTSGTVTVADTLPAGLTATDISGTGWSCVLGTLTCTRSNALAPGLSYPAITVTVNVANNAPASVTNTANVSGGGQVNTANDTATDPTTVNQRPDLTIAKSHSGNFTQGQTGATYSITVTNAGFAATDGSVVTVTDTLPAGLTATTITGTGWSCVLGTLTCTRSDVLAIGASYPAITLTVDVALTAPGSVTNSASVSGGGEINASNNTANDPTTIDTAGPPSVSLVKSVNPNGVQDPGSDLTYTIVYTNGGAQPAVTFILVDPDVLNVDPLERVFHNVDFKLGSMTSNPGTTGLVAAFEYSNDGGAAWTYAPVSGGGGAPAGYDRNVTNIRWVFAGSLSYIAPNNSGSVDFIVRIR